MGLTAPALYRYFPNRDALVTALIVEAYHSLAANMAGADAAKERDDFHGRFHAIALAFRAWAVQHPQDFALIYGTPIPGYVAPREQTVASATQVLLAIGCMLAEAWQAGRLTLPLSYQELPVVLHTAVTDILQAEILQAEILQTEILQTVPGAMPDGIPAGGVVLTMTIWAHLYGMVWGELFEHFPPGLADGGLFYQLEVATIGAGLGLGES